MAINSPKALTSSQVADYCGVSIRTVINWINKGILPAYQLPGTRGDNRIYDRDLRNFMERNSIPIPPELADTQKKSLTALVVDDDAMMAKAVARQLKLLGFSIDIANNGFEAGVVYASVRPRLMTLDLEMPKMDGFELLKQLHNRGNCKVLVVSGMGEKALQRAIIEGADKALPKPFGETGLVNAVKELFPELSLGG